MEGGAKDLCGCDGVKCANLNDYVLLLIGIGKRQEVH